MNQRGAILIIAVIGALTIVVIGVPFTEVQVEEEYQESVAYDVEVPFQVTVDKEWEEMSISTYDLLSGWHVYWARYIPQDRIVEFYISASDTVNMYVMTPAQFGKYCNGEYVEPLYEAEEVNSETLSFMCTSSREYYFVCLNSHIGLLGFGEKDIYIRVGWILSSWEEQETQYRTETEYRLETKTRTVTKKVTIVEKMLGDY